MEGADTAGPGLPARIAGIAKDAVTSPSFLRVLRHLETDDPLTLRQQVRLTEVPAPPFGEATPAGLFADLLKEAGATGVGSDDEGNVLGSVEGSGQGGPIVLAAHLDTVFPEGTPVRVREDGDRLLGPGISDNGRGLAAILAVVRCVRREGIALSGPLLVVGTVGEEGVGNLRGVRHLFGESGAAHRARALISLDGAGTQRIVTRGVGSRRLRLTLNGPGGHSWSDRGTANPLHALGAMVSELTDLPLPPGTTLNVGRVAGGISVNAIPEGGWMELEVRSVEEPVLDRLEARIRATVSDVAERTNAARRRGTDPLEVTWRILGSRPAGSTDTETPLVQAAMAATQELFGDVEAVEASTDANVPMHLGIPAITVGAGGDAGQYHTLDEWYRNVRGPEGIARALLTLLVLDRLLPG